MAHRTRIEIGGGVYYVVRRVSLGPDEFGRFTRGFAKAVQKRRCRVYAYCWLADSLHFIVKTGEPLHRLMASLPRRRELGGRRLRVRYRSVLIDPDAFLPELVGYLHWLPVLSGVALNLGEYTSTSHGAYLDPKRSRWLDTRAAGGGYRERVLVPPSADRIRLYETGSPHDPRILGGPEFIDSLPWRFRPHRSVRTLPDIAESVASLLEVKVEDIRSKSRARDLVLARALVAHIATSRKVATWREVGAYLDHAYTMLHALTQRYRERDPALFQSWAVCYSGPLLPLSRLVEGAQSGQDGGIEKGAGTYRFEQR